MKKTLSILLIFAIILALPFALVGCKKDESTDKTEPKALANSWAFTGEIDFGTNDPNDIINSSYSTRLNAARKQFRATTIIFNSDGTGVEKYNDGTEDYEFTWVKNGVDIITFSVNTPYGEDYLSSGSIDYKYIQGKLYVVFRINGAGEPMLIYGIFE